MVFPKTTGPFEVGCMDILTKAKSVPKDFHPETLHATKLGSLIRLFYPCIDKTKKFKRAKWLPEPFQKIYAYRYGKASQASSFFGWMMYLLARTYSIQAFHSVPVVDQEEWKAKQKIEILKAKEKLSFIVFSHGIKSNRTTYSTFCTQLASEGNVVAAVEHRDGSMSASFICDEENRVIEIPQYFLTEDEVAMKVRNIQLQQRTREISDAINLLEQVDRDPSRVVDLVNVFQLEHGCSSSGQTSGKLLESFKGRLDMDSMVMMGHSFGGTVTLNVLREKPRLRCGVSLDTWFEPLDEEFYEGKCEDEDKPVLLLFTEYYNFKDNVTLLNRFRDRYKKPESAEVVTLKEAIHVDQSDIPAILPRLFKSVVDNSRGPRIDYNVAIKVQRKLITDYINNFRQESSEPLFKDGYQLDDHFILGTYNVLGEEKTGDEVAMNGKNPDAKEEKVDEDTKS